MVKGKSLKLTTVALMIFTVLAFAAWAVFFIIFGIKEGIIAAHMVQMGLMFLPFMLPAEYAGLSVVSLILVALTLIFFLLMLIFSIIKRRGLMILPYFLICFGTFALVSFLANLPANAAIDPYPAIGYKAYFAAGDISQKIMAIGAMVCAILTYALAFLTFILALIHTCKYPKRKHPEVDEKLDETRVVPEAAPSDINGFLPEPEPEKPSLSEREELIMMIREVIHAELHSQPTNTNNVTGANFSAPLVVQYFNGNGQQVGPQSEEKKAEPEQQPVPVVKVEPVPEEVVEPELIVDEPVEEPVPVKEPEPQPEPEPEPVVEEPAPEPEPEPVKEEPVQEPEPQPEPEPVVVEEPAPVVEEKAKIIRIPFEERITTADKEMMDNYNELKNDIMAYGVKSRVSNSGDTFRLHRKTYVKLTIAGKSLKLYFALNPDDYKDSTLPIQDASEKNIYAEIPLVFKVKSGLSMRRAKQLIADVMTPDGLVQGEVGKVNWVKEIAAQMKEGKKASSDDDDDE